MPRADQPIRQWTILKLLESNRKITLQRIASELSEPCHERTLRRDLDALGAAGFPIYSERENGKSYWKLGENYRTAPLPLTATELYALQCGKQLLAPLEGTFIAESIQSLYQKINANLTPKNRDYASLLKQTVQIGIPPYKVYKAHRLLIEQMKQAIEQSKTVEMQYASLRGSPKRRRGNPYRLWYYKGAL
jgi:predicted DNA-binding transcriptional regulator YafY